MTEEYALFKAIQQLKSAAREDVGLRSLIEAIAAEEGDEASVTITSAEANLGWTDAVAAGLAAIGRAIDEQRRFIRSNGEVKPIEKIKRVSKESVQHLARHSDYINTEQSGDEIVPDKLYSVERLNDYATYENRFLYTLLCMLKEYIARKLSRLLSSNSYEGGLRIRKTVAYGRRRLSVDVAIKDVREGYAAAGGGCDAERIEQLSQSVDYYLRTPIMLEAAKADKIRSLTLTNILRMDKNFRDAVALYEFILSEKDENPNTSVKKGQNSDPFELALPALMYAYILYSNGCGLKEALADGYRREEQRISAQKREELKNAQNGRSAEEYMLYLEELNGGLAEEAGKLAAVRRELDAQKAENAKLKADLQSAGLRIDGMESAHAAMTEQLMARQAQLEEQNSTYIAEKEAEFAALRSEADGLLGEIAMLSSEKDILEARFTALRAQCGNIGGGEFDGEEAFDSLEKQYEVLGRLLSDEWKGVKKALRAQAKADLKAGLNKKRGNSKKGKDGAEHE